MRLHSLSAYELRCCDLWLYVLTDIIAEWSICIALLIVCHGDASCARQLLRYTLVTCTFSIAGCATGFATWEQTNWCLIESNLRNYFNTLKNFCILCWLRNLNFNQLHVQSTKPCGTSSYHWLVMMVPVPCWLPTQICSNAIGLYKGCLCNELSKWCQKNKLVINCELN